MSIQALVSGDIDLAQLTGPAGVIANMKGADVVLNQLKSAKAKSNYFAQ